MTTRKQSIVIGALELLLFFCLHVAALDLPDERWLRQLADDDSITNIMEINFEPETSQASIQVLTNFLDTIGCSPLRRLIPYSEKHEEARKKFGLDLVYRSDCTNARDPMATARDTFNVGPSAARNGLGGIQTAINLLRQRKDSGDPEFASFGLSNVAPEHKTNAKVVEGSEHLLVETEDNSFVQDPNLRGRKLASVNDEFYAKQPHYTAIDLEDAWDFVQDYWYRAKDVVVSVLDSGIDFRNTDLMYNNWTNPGEICDNGVDDDGNGEVDDCHGYNFVDQTGTDLLGNSEHGSHCAGTIGASSDNRIGVAGIAGGMDGQRGVSLMANLGFGNRGYGDGFAESLTYAAENGARISSNSWGYTRPGVYDRGVWKAVNYAASLGVSVVFAAGNDSTDAKYYPGGFRNVIGVAATYNSGKRVSWSNFGSWVDISAPGVDIASTGFRRRGRNRYIYMSGTSMACPHVSGVLALGLMYKPQATRIQLQDCLFQSATDIDNVNDGNCWNGSSDSCDSKLGAGLLNAAEFLKCLKGISYVTPNPTTSPTTASPVDGTPAPTSSPTTDTHYRTTMWSNLDTQGFENGQLGLWAKGGINARLDRRDSRFAVTGSGTVRLRDNSGPASSIMTALIPVLDNANQLRVTLNYVGRSMEPGEFFQLSIQHNQNGMNWEEVETWVANVDFSNRRKNKDVETIIDLPPNVDRFKLKFQCVASGRKDFVYLDDIRIDSRYNSLLDV